MKLCCETSLVFHLHVCLHLLTVWREFESFVGSGQVRQLGISNLLTLVFA